MKKVLTIVMILALSSSFAQELTYKKANVNYDNFEKLVKEVKVHRETRLISLNEFLKASKEDNVVILDTRSDSMYEAKHIAGAIHLNFADFTQENLKRLIPNPETKVLIYCNNNFDNMDDYFPTKIAMPAVIEKEIPQIKSGSLYETKPLIKNEGNPLTMKKRKGEKRKKERKTTLWLKR